MASVGDLFVTIGANAQPALEAFGRVEHGLSSIRSSATTTTGTLQTVADKSDSAFGRMAESALKLLTAYRLLTLAVKTYNATAQASQGINPATGEAFGPRATAAIAAMNVQLAKLGPTGKFATAALAAGFSGLIPILTKVRNILAALASAVLVWKVAVVTMAATVATTLAGIAGAFKSAQLKESIGAVEAIFKDAAKPVKDFADQVSAAFGRSKKNTLDAATQIGAILTSQGFSEADAATNSIFLMGTAMELAAQRGGTTANALAAVAAAVRGEEEPIRRLGITISEALVDKTIKANASLTKLAQTNEFTAKSAARLILIKQQSAAAFGTMAKESGNLTQQLEKFKGLLSQLFTDLGNGFEPLVTAFFRLMNSIMQLTGQAMPTFASGIEMMLSPLTAFVDMLARAVEGINALIGRSAKIPQLGGNIAMPQGMGDPAMDAFKAEQDKFAAEKEHQNRLDALLTEMADREKARQLEISKIRSSYIDDIRNAANQQETLIQRRDAITASMNRADITSAADVFARNINAGMDDPQLKELREIKEAIKEHGQFWGVLN